MNYQEPKYQMTSLSETEEVFPLVLHINSMMLLLLLFLIAVTATVPEGRMAMRLNTSAARAILASARDQYRDIPYDTPLSLIMNPNSPNHWQLQCEWIDVKELPDYTLFTCTLGK